MIKKIINTRNKVATRFYKNFIKFYKSSTATVAAVVAVNAEDDFRYWAPAMDTDHRKWSAILSRDSNSLMLRSPHEIVQSFPGKPVPDRFVHRNMTFVAFAIGHRRFDGPAMMALMG